MNWREVTIGGLSALAVSVISGVATYYLTRDPKPPDGEILLYKTKTPVTVLAGKIALSSFSFSIRNAGGSAAENVNALISLSAEAKLLSLNAEVTPPGETGLIKKVRGSILDVTFPRLLPGEQIVVDIGVSGAMAPLPIISVKSNKKLGVRELEGDKSVASDKPLSTIVSIVVLTVFLSSALMLGLQKHLLRKMFPIIYKVPSTDQADVASNVAFVLIHSGLHTEACTMLERQLKEGSLSPLGMANLGLATGLSGDESRMVVLLEAAEFYARENRRTLAVIAFNKATKAASEENVALMEDQLKLAATLDLNEIRHYLAFSKFYERFQDNPYIKELTQSDDKTRRPEP